MHYIVRFVEIHDVQMKQRLKAATTTKRQYTCKITDIVQNERIRCNYGKRLFEAAPNIYRIYSHNRIVPTLSALVAATATDIFTTNCNTGLFAHLYLSRSRAPRIFHSFYNNCYTLANVFSLLTSLILFFFLT